MKTRSYVRGVFCLIGAGLFGAFGWHFREYGLKLGWEPQTLSAADLIKKGPGANLKVQLTGYQLGEPLVETFNDSVTSAWFPVTVAGSAKPANPNEIPPIFYHRSAADTRDRFEAVRQQPVIRGIVANDLSVWPDRPTPELLRAYPGLEKAKVIYLRDTNIPLQYLVYIAWTGVGLLTIRGALHFRKAARGGETANLPGGAATGSRTLQARPRVNTAVVPVYQARPGTIPPELEALGEPEQIHKPTWIYTIGKEQPALIVLCGLAVLSITLVLAVTVPLQGHPFLVGGITLLGLLGVGLAALPFLPFDYIETFVVYRDALLVIRGDTFAVIRWDAIKALDGGRYLITADDQAFGLAEFNEVGNDAQLISRVRDELSKRMLPPAMAKLYAGETLNFGDFAVNRSGVGYKDTFVPWERVAEMSVAHLPRLAMRMFVVKERGSLLLNAISANLNCVSNDWLFLEVVRQASPSHLDVTPAR